MKCTVCKAGWLDHAMLDGALVCKQCSHCGGHWIKLDDYLPWQQQQPVCDAVVEEIDVEVETLKSENARLCPETGGLMSKFRISSDTGHRLDWSEHAAGIWLDKGEWKLLVEKGVADKLNRIFSDDWQKKIRQQTTKNNREGRFIEQLGEENYSRLQLVRTWLHEQSAENRAVMISFLVAKDPFRDR